MTKKIEVFVVSFIFIIAILLLIFSPSIGERFLTFTTIISTSAAYLSYLNDNSVTFFVVWNKIKSFFKADTVSWNATYKFSFIEENYNFEEDVEAFINRLKQSDSSIKIKNKKVSSTNSYFTIIHQGYEKNIEIFLDKPSMSEDKLYKITFKYIVSISYKDSLKEVERYGLVLKHIKPGHKILAKDTTDNINLLEQYAVKLSFAKFNPFYGLTVKNISTEAKDIEFNLTFNIEDVNIKINKNTLIAISNNQEKVINVLRDYVAMSTIGD